MKSMRERIYDILVSAKKPLNKNELAKKAGGYKADRHEYTTALRQLLAKGDIVESRGRYGIARRVNGMPAEIVKVAGTFGFASFLESSEKDVFIPGKYLMGAMPGDKVLLKLSSRMSSGGSPEGEVVKILEYAQKPFVGIVSKSDDGKYYVTADSYLQFPMLVDGGLPLGVNIGDKVLVTVSYHGKSHSDHKVKIIQHFGSAEKASVCALAALAENNVDIEFSEEALEQARAIGGLTGIHPKEIEQRTDLREWNIFTIDGADTKDIDDAISLTKTSNGWELGVHIADVSYYVTRNSPLDKDAFKRGTSVYYANQVVPMLPKELSNGICSLNPNEDRLAFSALVKLTPTGDIVDYRFEKTVICSRIKGVYSEINQIYSEDKTPTEIAEKYSGQMETLLYMRDLAKLLNEKRMARGAINLESRESKIIVDEQDVAIDIVPRTGGISENIIEEFMLVANEAAAKFSLSNKLPFVYRVHERPTDEKVNQFFELLDHLGISYQRPGKGVDVEKSLGDVLVKVKDTPISDVVNYSLLRTMMKAKYSAENLGHFGLSLQNYCHFTSPIRRYPDLAIHRVMTSFLTGMRRDNLEKHFRSWVSICSTQCTNRELASMGAERSAEDAYKAEYMKKFVGETFDGVVSSATNFGIFVELPNTVEGLIHITGFPEGFWKFDNFITYKNEVGGATVSVGDSIKILVARADVPTGRVDFAFAEPEKYTSKK